MRGKMGLLSALLILGATALWAEAPIEVTAPRKARGRVVDSARSYLGTPYRYGGTGRSGIDCSGLVAAVYSESLGTSLPRTARSLYAFIESVPRKELEPGDLIFFDTTASIAHVGIYEGEDYFIHAASEGPRTGVIESSLSEAYWARCYAGAGRIVPPGRYLGLILTASLAPCFGLGDSGFSFRGAELSAGLSFRLFSLELGLAARPSYDASLGVGRLPLVITLSLDRAFSVFAGPALTLGAPSLDWKGEARGYEAQGGVLATAGIVWTPLRFRAAGQDWGLYGEIVYDRYVPTTGEAASANADLAAQVHAGFGLRLRMGI
jgi:probable lipoprotein NlpC